MIKHLASSIPPASGGRWEPQDLCGFDLADVSSITRLNGMPDSVMGMVYTGARFIGNFEAFKAEADRWRGNPKVWGFYLIDEPYPEREPRISPAAIKQQADYIHETQPGVMACVKFTNLGSPERPHWHPYNIQSTGLDLFGVGGYAVRRRLQNGYDPELIKRYVDTAIRDGVPREKIFPCMQCFGGTADWPMPTEQQMDEMFQAWRENCPNPVFDMCYSWGVQTQWMTQALSNNEMMREAVKRHFAAQIAEPPSGSEGLRIRLSGTNDMLQIKQGDTLRVEAPATGPGLTLRASGVKDVFRIKRGDTLRVE